MRYFDGLETQTSEQRAAYIAEALPAQIAHAKQLPGYADRFKRVTASEMAVWSWMDLLRNCAKTLM